MRLRQPRATRTDPLVPYTTLFRSGAGHDLRSRAGRARSDALHRGCEVGDVERTLQRGRDARVADVDHHVRTLLSHVGHGTITAEAHDQLAGAAVAALEVDAGNGQPELGRASGMERVCQDV